MQDIYQSKLVSPEEAVSHIKSGDKVVIPLPREPNELLRCLFERRGELKNIQLLHPDPWYDPGWFQPGSEKSFNIKVPIIITGVCREAMNERRISFMPSTFSTEFKVYEQNDAKTKAADVVMIKVSPPDKNGYCSFGPYLFHKNSWARRAKVVMAEVDKALIRTWGGNYIHVSQIDYFVEGNSRMISDAELKSILTKQVKGEEKRKKLTFIFKHISPIERDYWLPRLLSFSDAAIDYFPRMLGIGEPQEDEKTVCQYAVSLIRDGDTLEIGGRPPAQYIPRLGLLDNKIDLGYHSEMGARGLARLVQGGVINGKRKTLLPGKFVLGGALGFGPEDLEAMADNPAFELYDSEWVNNVRVISSVENMVAINNITTIDFMGQASSESVMGGRYFAGPGGLPDFHIGSFNSKNGRAALCIRATALDGAVSRIVPQLDPGMAVTIPTFYVDYVISEFGIARLQGKTFRERANELIGIAHPKFRAELKKQAQKLFYP